MGFSSISPPTISLTPASATQNRVSPNADTTPGHVVSMPNGFATTAYEAQIAGEAFPRMVVSPNQLMAGTGDVTPNVPLSRLAAAGVATAGRWGSFSVRFDRSGCLNIADYGDGVGQGSASVDKAAIAAAIADLPSRGGEVLFPPSGADYLVDCTSSAGVTLPNDKAVTVRGIGQPVGNVPTAATLRRSAGTNTLLACPLDANEDVRFRGSLINMNIHGNGGTGRLVYFPRAGGLWDNVRVTGHATSGVTAHACHFTSAFNMTFRNCRFTALGNGSTHAAVLFSGETGDTEDNTNTVTMSDCQWEHNYGIDLWLSGIANPCTGVFVTNYKMERGKAGTNGSTYPFVNFAFAKGCHLTGGFMTVGGASPCDMIAQAGASSRANGVHNSFLEHQGGAAGLYFIINHSQGTFSATGNHFDNYASQLGASYRIASTVPRYGAAGKGTNTFFDTSARTYLDQRTVQSPGAGNGPEGL